MSDFFDESNVTDVGLEGSAGPSVGFFDMVSQGFQQQFRVDSARALDAELSDRWMKSLRALEVAGGGKFGAPSSFESYVGFAQHTQGLPVTAFPKTRPEVYGGGRFIRHVPDDPQKYIDQMQVANEAIKKLNNPEVKTFEQILAEVAEMQRDVETETGSMSERSGVAGKIGELIGAIGGSFTTRDPLNVITAPIGFGRTVATRIVSDMALAGGITAATEYGEVAPNRELVGLPERSALLNVAAATIGAGVIRGGIEGIGAGIRATPAYQQRQAIRELEDFDFDARDTSLRALLETLPESPRARAAISALDDTVFVEKNNPYGGGMAANERFMAELRQVAGALNGEPMTAVARVMPPVPFEYIEKAADFQIVKQQSPQVYARMEAAQAKLNQQSSLTRAFHGTAKEFDDYSISSALFERAVWFTSDAEVASGYAKVAAPGGYSGSHVRFNDLDTTNFTVHEMNGEKYNAVFVKEALEQAKAENKSGVIFKDYDDSIGGVPKASDVIAVLDEAVIKAPFERANLRRAANEEYQAAYREVEAEAAAIRAREAAAVAAQQREGANILAQVNEGRPFVGPLLRYDNVEALVDRINKVNETLDEATVARFQRETVGEGDDAIELEVWERDGGIDIGLREPVDPDFRFDTDDGTLTVAEAMRDLQDDTDLVEAIRSCAI